MRIMLMTMALAEAFTLNAVDDDQFRYLSVCRPCHHEKVKEFGFNLVGGSLFGVRWKFAKGERVVICP